MDWNDATIARLRMLWENGVTTADIGRRLGFSKNAVVGKAHRLELQKRPSPIKGRVTRGLALAPPSIPRPKITLPPLHSYVLPPVITAAQPRVVAPPPPPPPAPIIFRPRSQPCCWPIGHPKDKAFRFCFAPAPGSKPYCDEHSKIAYVRVRDRQEDAA